MNQLFTPGKLQQDARLFPLVQENIYKKGFEAECTREMEEEIITFTENQINRAFAGGDEDSLLDLHRSAFQIMTANFAVHWQTGAVNTHLPVFTRIVHIFGAALEKADRARLSGEFKALKDLTKGDFSTKIKAYIKNHPHNVQHPVFDYLEHDASFDQLCEFIVQEAPFDMLFGDILSLMLPGLYDDMKMEIMTNYIDEMGEKKVEGVHRTMRIEMMKKIGIPAERYENIEGFCIPELALANNYMLAGFNRNKLAELIGMMLATEEVVPGRLGKQVFGWRRVGVPDEHMPYLINHISLDVVHASGWMDNVVVPLVGQGEEIKDLLLWGVLKRLDVAGTICDTLLDRMKAM
ncbi:MAG: iron-containing redox enzyme family protein [Pseudoruegeria sp.]